MNTTKSVKQRNLKQIVKLIILKKSLILDTNIFEASKNKTRVLVLSTHSSVMKLLLEVLNFYQKEFDYYLDNGDFTNSNNDFVILQTSDLEKATLFEPNIALITSEIPNEELPLLLQKITAGGVLIYSTSVSEAVEKSENFFRRLEFRETEFQKSNTTFTLQTNIGAIPVSFSEEILIKNMEGIKLLSQQFGVMEEEFYEPVMGFE